MKSFSSFGIGLSHLRSSQQLVLKTLIHELSSDANIGVQNSAIQSCCLCLRVASMNSSKSIDKWTNISQKVGITINDSESNSGITQIFRNNALFRNNARFRNNPRFRNIWLVSKEHGEDCESSVSLFTSSLQAFGYRVSQKSFPALVWPNWLTRN
jgi:hypothetical protein